MKKEILTIWCFLTLLNLNGQEKERGIDEVIVQGKFLNLPLKKVNENITVVTRKEIENSPAKSVEEILAQFTGLDIRKFDDALTFKIALMVSNYMKYLSQHDF